MSNSYLYMYYINNKNIFKKPHYTFVHSFFICMFLQVRLIFLSLKHVFCEASLGGDILLHINKNSSKLVWKCYLHKLYSCLILMLLISISSKFVFLNVQTF